MSEEVSGVILPAVPHIPYPVALHTVDVAPIAKEKSGWKILLGRKPFSTKFQLFGGFLDPGETAEAGAARELKEESGLEVLPSDLSYLGSFFIDDGRYINSVHKITTSAFVVEVKKAIPCIGQDDIAEAIWFKYDYIKTNYKEVVEPLHWEIIEVLNKLYEDR